MKKEKSFSDNRLERAMSIIGITKKDIDGILKKIDTPNGNIKNIKKRLLEDIVDACTSALFHYQNSDTTKLWFRTCNPVINDISPRDYIKLFGPRKLILLIKEAKKMNTSLLSELKEEAHSYASDNNKTKYTDKYEFDAFIAGGRWASEKIEKDIQEVMTELELFCDQILYPFDGCITECDPKCECHQCKTYNLVSDMKALLKDWNKI